MSKNRLLTFTGAAILSSAFLLPSAQAQGNVINLADGEASAPTKQLFSYLQELSGQKVLFGHQHATDEGLTLTGSGLRAGSTESEVKNAVGDYPALFGWDTLSLDGYEKPGSLEQSAAQNRANLIESMKAAHNLGGTVALSTHPHNFVTGGSFNDTSGDVVENILPGGSHHDKFNAWLDHIATFANDLKDDNGNDIPVLFRMFHEQNGGWFWWGAQTTSPAEYKALYRYTVEYLRDVKGVDNFLYVYSPNGPFSGNEESYLKTYPGDDYVDVLGLDQYDNQDNPGTDAFLNTLVDDLAMVSTLAESKGKISALSEYGYSPKGMKTTGNGDLQWFTKLFDAIEADPDAKKISYMQTWANFALDGNLFVPYKNAPNGLGDHELLPDFTAFYEDPYSAFLKEAGEIYGKEVPETAVEKPFMHVVSPLNRTLSLTGETTVQVSVVQGKPSAVYYTVNDGSVKYPLSKSSGRYYEASAALTGDQATLHVTAEFEDGTKQTEAVQVYLKEAEKQQPTVVDTFETYYGDSDQLQNAFVTHGDPLQLALTNELKKEGSYALQYNYSLAGAGYTGMTKSLDHVDWSEADTLDFWLKADGKDQKMVIQLNAGGIAFEAYPSLASDEVKDVSIPFSSFKPAPWESPDRQNETLTPERLKDVSAFSIYVNATGSSPISSTLYLDDIRVSEKQAAQPIFNDVPASHWAHAYIHDLAGKEIVFGKTADSFAPAATVTRLEFTEMIVRALQIKSDQAETSFTDVPARAEEAVAAAHSAGIVFGKTARSFDPNKPITREEAAAILVRAHEWKTGTDAPAASLSFKDRSAISAFAAESVEKAVHLGFINGFSDGTFKPKQSSTRDQAAKIIWSLLNKNS